MTDITKISLFIIKCIDIPSTITRLKRVSKKNENETGTTFSRFSLVSDKLLTKYCVYFVLIGICYIVCNSIHCVLISH